MVNNSYYLCQAVLWNMDTLQTESTPEEHQYLITDVRFRPNSTQLATASFDKSVRLWDAANVIVSTPSFMIIFCGPGYDNHLHNSFISKLHFCCSHYSKFKILNILSLHLLLSPPQSLIRLILAAKLLFECIYRAPFTRYVPRFPSQEERSFLFL